MGRALRILLGLVLMIYAVPNYFQVPLPLAIGALLLMLGLIGAYSLIRIVISRRIVAFGPCFGAMVALGLLVALYAAGRPRVIGFGHGEGHFTSQRSPFSASRW